MANIRYMRTVSMTKEFTFIYISKFFLEKFDSHLFSIIIFQKK